MRVTRHIPFHDLLLFVAIAVFISFFAVTHANETTAEADPAAPAERPMIDAHALFAQMTAAEESAYGERVEQGEDGLGDGDLHSLEEDEDDEEILDLLDAMAELEGEEEEQPNLSDVPPEMQHPQGPPVLHWSAYAQQLHAMGGCATPIVLNEAKGAEGLPSPPSLHPTAVRIHTQHGLCTRPVMLVSLMPSHMCESCGRFLRDVWQPYRAELRMLAERHLITFVYVPPSLVDMVTVLQPLLPSLTWEWPRSAWLHRYVEHRLDHLLRERPLAISEGHESPSARRHKHTLTGIIVHEIDHFLQQSRRQYRSPTGDFASVMLDAFAPQMDYAPRVMFLYPHNYTVMPDVINEDTLEGASANMHFYVSPKPLFKSLHKAIRVMNLLLREERNTIHSLSSK